MGHTGYSGCNPFRVREMREDDLRGFLQIPSAGKSKAVGGGSQDRVGCKAKKPHTKWWSVYQSLCLFVDVSVGGLITVCVCLRGNSDGY